MYYLYTKYFSLSDPLPFSGISLRLPDLALVSVVTDFSERAPWQVRTCGDKDALQTELECGVY